MSRFPTAAIIGLVVGFSMLRLANLIDVAFRATDPEVKGTVLAPAWATRVPRTSRGWLAVWVWSTLNGRERCTPHYGRSLGAAEAFAASLNVGQSIPLYVSRRDPRNVEIFPPKTASLLPACLFLPGAYFFGRAWWHAVFRPGRSPSILVAAMLLIPVTLGFIDFALSSKLSVWVGLSVLGITMSLACYRVLR